MRLIELKQFGKRKLTNDVGNLLYLWIQHHGDKAYRGKQDETVGHDGTQSRCCSDGNDDEVRFPPPEPETKR